METLQKQSCPERCSLSRNHPESRILLPSIRHCSILTITILHPLVSLDWAAPRLSTRRSTTVPCDFVGFILRPFRLMGLKLTSRRMLILRRGRDFYQ